ncbi:hypothetical protein [Caproiciproducens sp. CPB-2]|uniref:hypothetical protein n=1 Tax=Caproiciproducens sp. CPB-2 TaxID=3030017 RepID=UPI0023DC5F97|nr:hypothetical protein [Caproiciproducens sp. CPB-2]MDF1494989.1 hypothetical protein [Caproiciproducens sp. CPB-2]
MKKKKRTLLDLDHIPTLDELRAYFKENDFSAATYVDVDYETMDAESVEALEYIKGLMDEKWEPLSREMGLKSDSSYYGKDNPLIAMCNNMESLVAGGVMKLLNEKPEVAAEILDHFFQDPDVEQHADDFLNNAVKTAMQVMNYEELAQVVQDNAAYEDFNHDKFDNYRSKDFDRKWNHTRSKTETVSFNEMEDTVNGEGESSPVQVADTSVNVEDEVITHLTGKTFWDSISDDDRTLLRMRMSGKTQQEIADTLGYKTHSAVTKRLQKLKEIFENSDQ